MDLNTTMFLRRSFSSLVSAGSSRSGSALLSPAALQAYARRTPEMSPAMRPAGPPPPLHKSISFAAIGFRVAAFAGVFGGLYFILPYAEVRAWFAALAVPKGGALAEPLAAAATAPPPPTPVEK